MQNRLRWNIRREELPLSKEQQYTASEIQVLEGLEAVRRRRACTLAPRQQKGRTT